MPDSSESSQPRSTNIIASYAAKILDTRSIPFEIDLFVRRYDRSQRHHFQEHQEDGVGFRF